MANIFLQSKGNHKVYEKIKSTKGKREREMAMRQRFGGISSVRPRLSSRSIYEDFKPHFELKEEQEAHVIQVHLPGLYFTQLCHSFFK